METIIRFANVSFDFGHNKTILDSVSFTIKGGMKVALMGQNGAGKSTIFKLLTRYLRPEGGEIFVKTSTTIATAFQVMSEEDKSLTVQKYFQKYCQEAPHEVNRRMNDVLEVVNLIASPQKLIADFSGGQQARLLLAAALIQQPDVLLLDINMPKMNGLEVLKALKDRKSKVKVLVLTAHNETEYLMKAVDIGINGYVLKESESAELKKAIFTIADGETYIQPSLIPALNSKMIQKNEDELKIDALT